MILGSFLARNTILNFGLVVKLISYSCSVNLMNLELLLILSIIFSSYRKLSVQSVRVYRLCYRNEFSADNLGIFDLLKVLNRDLLFHKIRGYRRLLENLSSKRLLAFRERF